MDWLLTCLLIAGIFGLLAVGMWLDRRRDESMTEAEREEDWFNQQW